MKKLAATLLGLSLCGAPVLAQSITDTPEDFLPAKSLAAQGCMKVGDCTQKVVPITSIDVLIEHYGEDWLTPDLSYEMTALIDRLNAVGVQLYLGSDFYFQVGVRGVYYTDNNGMYMNEFHGRNPYTFLSVLRHEAWHAAQDCMAGSIDNSFIAIILDPAEIPDDVKMMTEIRYKFYAPASIPWEQEAIYAAGVANMTADALNACAAGQMWTEYIPTPKTEEWLKQKGFMK